VAEPPSGPKKISVEKKKRILEDGGSAINPDTFTLRAEAQPASTSSDLAHL